MIISFTNVIGAIRSLGEAAQVITTNLKMWLGFETSETLGRELAPSSLSIVTDGGNGTITQISENSYNSSSDGTSGIIRPKIDFNTESGKTYKLVITPTGVITGTVHFDFYDGSSYLFQNYDFTETKEIDFTDNGQVFGAFDGQQVYNITGFTISVKELTQITPDKSGNNNVGELLTGKAIELDGVNDEIDFGTAQIPIKTISFWIKPLSVSNEGLFYLGLSSFPQFRQISITSGNISATSYFTNFTPYVNNIQTSAVTQDVWQRVVLTFDEWTTTSLQIGKVYSSVYGHFAISDVQFYNETWSTDDIAFDYANPNKLAIDNPSTSLSVTNLKAYWALSEGDGLVAYDSGTNLEEEEVVDGDFPLPNVNWTTQTKWTIANNTARLVSNNTDSSFLIQDSVFEIGKTYNLTFDATVVIGTAKFIDSTGGTKLEINETKDYDFTFVADRTDFRINRKSTVSDITISNVSVREVTASDHGGLINGATYVLNQPRIPQLGMMNWSKGSNLFPYSENFTEWVISPTTSQVLLEPTEAAPYGQGDVYSIIMQASESDAYIRYATTNATLTSSTHSVWVKQAPTGSATHIRITNNNRAAWNTGTSQKIALTSSWQRLETTDAITGNRFTIIGSADVSGTQDSDCIGKALIYGAQLLEGSSAGVYRFTDGAATSNSTVIANPTIPTQDIFGNLVRDRLNSFNLDGSGYAEVADDADLDLGTGDFSVEAWVKFEFKNQGSGFNVIYCNGNEFNDSNTFSLSSNSSSKISFLVNNTSCNSTSTFSLNEWVHVVGTRIQGTNGVKLYINGNTTPEDTATNNNTVTNSFDKTVGYDTHSSRYYNNIISDVRVYSKALTSDEVENNYNAGLSAHRN